MVTAYSRIDEIKGSYYLYKDQDKPIQQVDKNGNRLKYFIQNITGVSSYQQRLQQLTSTVCNLSAQAPCHTRPTQHPLSQPARVHLQNESSNHQKNSRDIHFSPGQSKIRVKSTDRCTRPYPRPSPPEGKCSQRGHLLSVMSIANRQLRLIPRRSLLRPQL